MHTLVAEQCLRTRVPSGTRVACVSGALWVTRSGDPRDLVLRAGESIVLPRGVAVIAALERSGVEVARPRRWRRLRDWLLRVSSDAAAP